MTRKTVALTVFAVLCLSVAGRAEDEKNVAGTWVPTSGTMSGKAMAADVLKTTELTLGDGKYTVNTGGETESGAYKVNQKAKPKTVEITHGEGPQKGKVTKALYELKGDTMKICYNLKGDDFPKDFTSTEENKYLIFVYKRQK